MVATVSEVIEKVDKPGGLQSSQDSDDCDGSFTILSSELPNFKLKVHSPKTVSSPNGDYTTYSVLFRSTTPAFRLKKSDVQRRFSEFVWLRKELVKVDNWRSPPSLPPKRFWNLLDPDFIETRRKQLEKWLHSVLSEPEYLSSSALHLFLQTEMTSQHIQQYLDGEVPEETIQQIWTNQGRLYNYQPHNLLHNTFYQEPTEIRCTEEDIKTPIPSALPSQSLPEQPPSSPRALYSNPDTEGEMNSQGEDAQSQNEQGHNLLCGHKSNPQAERRLAPQATNEPTRESQLVQQELQVQEELQETIEQRVDLSRSTEETPDGKDGVEDALFEVKGRSTSPDSGFQEEKNPQAVVDHAKKTVESSAAPQVSLSLVRQIHSINSD